MTLQRAETLVAAWPGLDAGSATRRDAEGTVIDRGERRFFT